MQELERTLDGTLYNRQRMAPLPGEPLYLCLSDLRLAMETVRTSEPLRLLDFGCGGSPYRELFPHADYVRADYTQVSGLDVPIAPGKPLPLADGSFDLILSTQVLEHVEDVGWYLGEAHRLLKPGGRLVLSTHGFFQDHGCPYDFFRWTGEGLRVQLALSRFNVDKLFLLTGGMRMALTCFETMPLDWRWNEGGGHGMVVSLFMRLLHVFKSGVHSWADRQFANQRVIDGGPASARSYIGLFVIASPAHPPEEN